MSKYSVGDKLESVGSPYSFQPYEITYVGKDGYVYQDRDKDEAYESFTYFDNERRYQLAKPPVPVKGETWEGNGDGWYGKVTIRLSEDDVVVYQYADNGTVPYVLSVNRFMDNLTKVSE